MMITVESFVRSEGACATSLVRSASARPRFNDGFERRHEEQSNRERAGYL